MTTLSVPIPPNLEEFINRMVKSGKAANKADVVRKALRYMSDEEAVSEILKSQAEARAGRLLDGDIRELVKRI